MKGLRIVAAVAVVAFVAWRLWPPAPEAASGDPRRPTAIRGSDRALPQIALARLDATSREAPVGRRDLFEFGQRPPLAGGPAASDRPPPPPSTPAARIPPSTPPPAPALEPAANLRYIGRLDREGLRLAVLLTDGDEVLTGQVGELVGSRFRIVGIGLESVDVKDLGSERVLRIPLKGN